MNAVEPVVDTSSGRISIIFRPFSPIYSDLWFWQAEKQFEMGGITEDYTKFCYVVGNIHAKYLTEVRDIIQRPPETGKYEKLKTELIRRLGTQQNQMMGTYLQAGSELSENLVQSLERPSSIQENLNTQSLPMPAKTALEASIDKLTEAMAALTTQLEWMQTENMAIRRKGRSRTRSRSASLRSVRSTSNVRNNSGICWYHFHFGQNARKCSKSSCSRRTGNVGKW